MKWYLIITKPKEEERVAKIFLDGGVEFYFPRLKRKGIKRNQISEIREPLFPRYIFVRTMIERDYRKIKYTRGVAGFVDFGMGPEKVDEEIVGRIKSREKDGFIHIEPKKDRLRKNDRLKIKRGVFKDIEAVFEGYMSKDERVCLLLENISSNIKINIPKYYL